MKTHLLRALDLLWPARPDTWREAGARLGPPVANMVRLSLASTLAFVLTRWLSRGPMDLTSALTALLVMQASAAGSFKQGMLKVVGVMMGVGMALGTTSLVGLHWWSLCLLVLASLILAKLLRLGDAALELPISAMLILGSVGRTDVAAETRIIGTLIGTIVGVVLPLLLPPALPWRSAAASVRRVATQEAELLRRASAELDDQLLTKPMIAAWITKGRQITDQISKAHSQVSRMSEVRKFNSRAVGTADISPILTSGLDSLESCLMSLRSLFQTMERRAPIADHPSLGRSGPGTTGFSIGVQGAIGRVLGELASCLEAFGVMVEAEALGNEKKAHGLFVQNYRALRAARQELAEVMAQADDAGNEWLMRGGILLALDQVMQQLDVDARVRVRDRWKASQLGRRLPESNIGPRSNTIDRFRHARMRARQEHQPDHSETSADFLVDDEPTQRIPVITPQTNPPEGMKKPRGWNPRGRR